MSYAVISKVSPSFASFLYIFTISSSLSISYSQTPHAARSSLDKHTLSKRLGRTTNLFFLFVIHIYIAVSLSNPFRKCFSSNCLYGLVTHCMHSPIKSIVTYPCFPFTFFFSINLLITESEYRKKWNFKDIGVGTNINGEYVLCLLQHQWLVRTVLTIFICKREVTERYRQPNTNCMVHLAT